MLEEFDDVLRPTEAMEILKVGPNGLYQLLSTGKLHGYRHGRVWRIPKQAIIEFIIKEANL